MEKEKILTVVIPSYNVEKYLEHTVSSFLSKEINDEIEILIVNDGSKDHTAEIGKKLEEQYPETVRLINKENGGHGSTINRGLSEAKGKYFKVVDGDDWVDEKAFVQFVRKLKTYDADVIFAPYTEVHVDENRKKNVGVVSLEENIVYDMEDVISSIGDEYVMHSITYRTSLIQGSLKLDEHCFYVDQEYVMFPFVNVHTLMYFHTPVYQYRLGTGEQSMNWKNMIKNRYMHEKVTYSLLDRYTSDLEKLSGNRLAFYQNRICSVAFAQVYIFLKMDSPEGRKEFLAFWKDLKKRYPENYALMKSKKSGQLLQIMPDAGYRILAAYRRKH